ncbi:MAG: BrnA antitoxin family protein [Acidobacteria bacterium]|nr:BrnA antitoxin family protein [Acidobacteriota bacterium]
MPRTASTFTRQEMRTGVRIADTSQLGDAIRTLEKRRRRGKQVAPTKVLVSIRVSRNVLDTYRKTGTGWQTRMHDDLEKAARRRAKQAAF